MFDCNGSEFIHDQSSHITPIAVVIHTAEYPSIITEGISTLIDHPLSYPSIEISIRWHVAFRARREHHHGIAGPHHIYFIVMTRQSGRLYHPWPIHAESRPSRGRKHANLIRADHPSDGEERRTIDISRFTQLKGESLEDGRYSIEFHRRFHT